MKTPAHTVVSQATKSQAVRERELVRERALQLVLEIKSVPYSGDNALFNASSLPLSVDEIMSAAKRFAAFIEEG